MLRGPVCEKATSLSETPQHQGALGVTASYKPPMLVTRVRLPEGAFAACQRAPLRFVSAPRFRVCEPLSVLRASGHGLCSLRNAFMVFSFGLGPAPRFFFPPNIWCNHVEGQDYRLFFGSSCTSRASLLRIRVSASFVFSFFFFLLLAPAQGTDPSKC